MDEIDHTIPSNTLYVGISELPNELLVEVFFRCIEVVTELAMSKAGDGYLLRPYSWLTITHVCRHWRQLSLQTSSMWANITYFPKVGPRIIGEMLVRAKHAPLAIRAIHSGHSDGTIPKHLKDLLCRLDRARLADLDFPSTYYGELDKIVPRHLPRLTTLRLNAHSGIVAFPKHLLTCSMPALRELIMTSPEVQWQSPVFQQLSLRKLVIRGATFEPVMLNAMRGLPNLKHLDLKGHFKILDAPRTGRILRTVPPESQVMLSQLEWVGLEGQLLQITGFLNHLQFPHTASIHLCSAGPPSSHDIPAVIPYIVKKFAQHTDPKSGTPMRSLALWSNALFRFKEDNMSTATYVDFYTAVISVQDEPICSPDGHQVPHLRLGVRYSPMKDFDVTALLQELVLSLHIADIETAIISRLPPSDTIEPVYADLLGRMPKITALRIGGHPGPATYLIRLLYHVVEDTLASSESDAVVPPRKSLLVPLLRTLHVHDTFFCGFYMGRDPRWTHEALIDALEWRSEWGLGLTKVSPGRMYMEV
ncbi:hypothetical protein BXZ70DRAFT_1007517 [Cristinia sonorae]|uniref:F-box domain-containing protein n=1 Tax=Cristinia sonorae TaxID=1940300 RepID=A0A8K0XQV6_9AGAR|nr:hypothetical protein BXZ70DRAFT_1007517 [Cristinia sonorae]